MGSYTILISVAQMMEESHEAPSKKAKVEDVESDLKSLKEFKLRQVLNEKPERRTIFLEGEFQDKPGTAILILEKTPFISTDVENVISTSVISEKLFHNSIYGNYLISPQSDFNCKSSAIFLILNPMQFHS